MPDHTNRYYDRPGFGNHRTPPSTRQRPASTWPDGRQPKHGGVTIFNRKPTEQQPKRPNDRQESHR